MNWWLMELEQNNFYLRFFDSGKIIVCRCIYLLIKWRIIATKKTINLHSNNFNTVITTLSLFICTKNYQTNVTLTHLHNTHTERPWIPNENILCRFFCSLLTRTLSITFFDLYIRANPTEMVSNKTVWVI